MSDSGDRRRVSGPDEMLRTFFGVRIEATAGLRESLKHLETMGRGLKVVSPSQLHVTLKFLGETQASVVPELERLLRDTCCDERSFDAAAIGLGAFPHAGRPSVIWSGIEPAEPLGRIAAALEHAVEPLGFAREARPFRPHITLARVKSRPPAELAEWLRRNETARLGELRIDGVVLYRSDMGQEGPRYTVVSRVELK